jgi:hypothetical protein
MSADFVPYLAKLKKGAAPNGAEAPPKEASTDGKAFAPLPAPTPTPTTPTAATPPLSQNQQTAGPSISVTRDGNRVTRIQVKCACGEVIELACTY